MGMDINQNKYMALVAKKDSIEAKANAPKEAGAPKEIGASAFSAKAAAAHKKPDAASNPFATDAKKEDVKSELDKINKELEAIKAQNAKPVQASTMQFEG